jgi:hypothetical protein
VAANGAMAAATTGITSWYKEGVKVAEGQANGLPLTCTQASEFLFTTKIAGTALKVKATGAECPESKIYNQASAEGAMALFTGKLKFTGVSVVEPANCGIAATVTSKPLLGALYMDEEDSDLQLIPSSGSALMILEITGAACTVPGAHKMNGLVYSREEKLTGEAAETQKFAFSGLINEEAGGSLTVGTEPATISGQLGVKLAAPNAGQQFESK